MKRLTKKDNFQINFIGGNITKNEWGTESLRKWETKKGFYYFENKRENKREKMGKDQLDFSHFEKSFDNQYDIVAPEFGDLH